MLVPIRDQDAFLRAPLGRCLVRPAFAVWCATRDLCGAIVRATLDEPVLRDLLAIAKRLPPARCTLIDLREVERVDAHALLRAAAAAAGLDPAWAARHERQALVIPGGIAGLVLAGAPRIAGARSMRCVREIAQAVAHLDHPGAAEAHTAALALVERRPPLLARLHAVLEADLAHATIEPAARALAMSPRTLQRELHRLATSFTAERRRARAAAAEQLLVYTDRKVDHIAAEVGTGTASRLSSLVRRAYARTPTGLRAAARS